MLKEYEQTAMDVVSHFEGQCDYHHVERAVCFHMIGNVRIKNVGKYQSCMVAKLERR